MTSQLRMYKVKDGELDAFIEEWREQILPVRRKYGFRLDGAWCIRATGEFIWVISYEGPEGFEAREAAYYASPERKALSPGPARHLAHTDTRLMESVAS